MRVSSCFFMGNNEGGIMAGLNKVENYLIDLDFRYEEIGPGTYLINDAKRGLRQVVVAYEEPIVMVRTKVMDVPAAGREAFYETLLKLNASDLLHGAYAIEGSEVVIVDTLEQDTMDKSELEASLDAIGLALAQHYPTLSKFRN